MQSDNQKIENFIDTLISEDNADKDSVLDIDNDNRFLAELADDRQIDIDSIRVIRIVESPMYKESTSTPEEYARLMNYLLESYSEEYAESISYYLYKMFSTYPSKFSELKYYLEKLPTEDQDEIRYQLTILLSFEFLNAHEDLPNNKLRDLFIETYPYLSQFENCVEEFDRQLKYNMANIQ